MAPTLKWLPALLTIPKGEPNTCSGAPWMGFAVFYSAAETVSGFIRYFRYTILASPGQYMPQIVASV